MTITSKRPGPGFGCSNRSSTAWWHSRHGLVHEDEPVLVVAPGEQRCHLRRHWVTALPRPQQRVGGVWPPLHAADGPNVATLQRGADGGKGPEAPRREKR